ncbi:MAG: adenylosuccinate synthase [Anaerovibrio sp.]|uniref:adenylosuccinate synthase n=1 Tax=Anaerovibrio sp. TaxID=1872532 RepID=UPI0025BFCCC7|nr:adenylosuccinate synthase [Anaerovibrio sp.]MBE6098830.1 adenylosuccinate synthase [Anaerovibrio sp.]
MASVAVLGTQWGDEGKGKIVDYLAQQAEVVVRSQGGSNAGHTVVVDGVEYKLRLMPSGILFKGTLNVIGNGVAFNPKVMLQEMDNMTAKGIDVSGIRISNRAHVVLPYHCEMDGYLEELKGANKVGTTKNGIGPCYVDRDDRIGIRVCDFIDKEEFAKRLKENLDIKNKQIVGMYGKEPFDYETILKEYEGYADRLRPYVCDTIALLHDELKAGKKVLFEGAQATMLDIDYGTYPYVTASHPVSGGVCVGAGVAPRDIDKVVGVVKAYCTRVGEGPFPTEQLNEVGDKIRELGHEFGTVTGRPRRTGWLDACVVRYAGLLSGIDYMAITRLDILDTLPEIKMCVGYKYNGEVINEIPASLKVLAEVEPVYETFEGWQTDISGIRKYEDLPEKARKYLERLAEVTGIDLGIVSVGPNRDQTIILAKDLF